MDISLNCVRRQGHAIGPGIVEQLVARQDLAGPAQQALEDRELALAEVDGLARNGDPPSRLVKFDRAGSQRRRLTGRRAPSEGPKSSQQLSLIHISEPTRL